MRRRERPAGSPPLPTPRARGAGGLGWLVGVLLVVVVAASFGPALVGRGLAIDVDLLNRYLPFAADRTLSPDTIVCRGDTVDFYLPGVASIVEAAKHGNWQTWAPYEVGGAPLASLPNHAVLSPVSWPYWVMPLWLAPAYVALTQLVLCVGGMVLFLARHGVRRAAAALAGLVFATCGFMVMWANWPHTKVGALVPLLLWSLDRTVTSRGARAATTNLALVGLVVASMLLGGFPAVTLFALTVGAVYAVVRGLRQPWAVRLSGWAVALGGVLLGVGLAAVQLLPFVRNVSALALEERVVGTNLPSGAFLTALAPDVFGTCRGSLLPGPKNPVEMIGFLGAGALVMAVCAFTVRLRRGSMPLPVLLGAMLVATVWLVWIGAEPLRLLQRLPGYSTNSIGRAQVVFGFLGAALAGLGLERLLRRSEEPARAPGERSAPPWPVVLALVAIVAAAAAWFGHQAHLTAQAYDGLPLLRRELVLPLVLLGAALLGVAVTLLARGRLRLVGVAAVVLVVGVQSTVFAHRMLPLSERADFYPVTPAHRFLQDNIGHERYAASGNWGYLATSDRYGLRVPVGHEFAAPAWKDLLAALSPSTLRSPTYSVLPRSLGVRRAASSPILDRMAVRYWAADPGAVTGRRSRWTVPSTGPVPLAPGAPVSCDLGPGAVRGVEVELAAALPAASPPARIHLRLTQGTTTLQSVGALRTSLAAGDPLTVGVAGEGLDPFLPVSAQVWLTGTTGPVALGGSDGATACRAVRPADDGLRLVHADQGSVIYQRLTALPRIRWAGRGVAVADPAARVAALAAGVPADTVVLDRAADGPAAAGPADGQPTAGSGAPGRVDVVTDDPETIIARVDADGDGFLVVADSIARDGWEASVDGRPVDVLPADHAMAAVAVPAGSHVVTFHYVAPGLRTGLTVSLGSGLLVAGLLGWPLVTRRRRSDRLDSAV